MTLKKYLLIHIGLTILVCAAVIWPVLHYFSPDFFWLAYLAIGLTSSTSLLAFVLVFRALDKPFKFFLNFVVGGMFAKMLVGIIAILSLGLNLPKDKLFFFAVVFLICYLIFTTLEVTSLMRKNKALKANSNEEEKISDNQHKSS